MILGNAKINKGVQNLKIWGNSWGCNNWRLPGGPRSLDDYFLSNRLFNNNKPIEFF